MQDFGISSVDRRGQVGSRLRFPGEFVPIRISAFLIPGHPGQNHRNSTGVGDSGEHQAAAHECGQQRGPDVPETEHRAE